MSDHASAQRPQTARGPADNPTRAQRPESQLAAGARRQVVRELSRRTSGARRQVVRDLSRR
ncbi:MAG TPA: hypothetical protein H9788_11480, partial [Candidatus Brevibacterium intestinavium]|nr:hypothetical protein [Candidatus Brevibacterium intestinavium]